MKEKIKIQNKTFQIERWIEESMDEQRLNEIQWDIQYIIEENDPEQPIWQKMEEAERFSEVLEEKKKQKSLFFSLAFYIEEQVEQICYGLSEAEMNVFNMQNNQIRFEKEKRQWFIESIIITIESTITILRNTIRSEFLQVMKSKLLRSKWIPQRTRELMIDGWNEKEQREDRNEAKKQYKLKRQNEMEKRNREKIHIAMAQTMNNKAKIFENLQNRPEKNDLKGRKFEIFTDASINKGEECGAIIIQEIKENTKQTRQILLLKRKQTGYGESNSYNIEAFTILVAVQYIKKLAIEPIIYVRGDNQSLMSDIELENQKKNILELSEKRIQTQTLQKIINIKNKFQFSSFIWIPRELNQIADFYSKEENIEQELKSKNYVEIQSSLFQANFFLGEIEIQDAYIKFEISQRNITISSKNNQEKKNINTYLDVLDKHVYLALRMVVELINEKKNIEKISFPNVIFKIEDQRQQTIERENMQTWLIKESMQNRINLELIYNNQPIVTTNRILQQTQIKKNIQMKQMIEGNQQRWKQYFNNLFEKKQMIYEQMEIEQESFSQASTQDDDKIIRGQDEDEILDNIQAFEEIEQLNLAKEAYQDIRMELEINNINNIFEDNYDLFEDLDEE